MRPRKYVIIPVGILDNADLSPSEIYLITQILRRQSEFETFTVADLKTVLKLSENTIRYGMLKLTECGYLSKGEAKGTWMLNKDEIDASEPQNLILNTSKSDAQSLKICGEEKEEERSKEEDKEYIYNNTLSDSNSLKIQENEKEKEIPKKEKDGLEELPERFSKEYREIINYLNEKTGKKYSAKSRVNQGHMSARLKEGFTVEDFKKVIDTKCFQWKDDPKMSQFLRPETLFSTKFDRYLNEEKSVRRVTENGWEYVKTEEPNFLDEILG